MQGAHQSASNFGNVVTEGQTGAHDEQRFRVTGTLLGPTR